MGRLEDERKEEEAEANEPPITNTKKLIVFVHGGVVQGIYTNDPDLKVFLHDQDNVDNGDDLAEMMAEEYPTADLDEYDGLVEMCNEDDEDDLTESNAILDSYPGGVCPDCGAHIPQNIRNEESCEGCGHVFQLPKEDEE